jgi:hypothetical protein
MPNLPDSPRGGVPPIGDAGYEALLAGNLPPADADEGLRPVAEAVAALALAPSARELAGEPDARAAYREGFGLPARPARAGRGRKRVLASVLSAKLAAAAVVAAGGLTAAAYAGVLPAPVQSFAHHTVGAPAPHPAPTPGQPVTPAGPTPDGKTPPGHRASHAPGKPPAAPSHSIGKPASHPTHPAHPSHPPHPSHVPAGHPSHPAHKPASHPTSHP